MVEYAHLMTGCTAIRHFPLSDYSGVTSMSASQFIPCGWNFKDLTGQRFGRLVVVTRDTTKLRRVYWRCQCDCGTVKSVASDKLVAGETRSCGCYNRDNLAVIKATHGLTRVGQHHPLHTVWCQMRARCQDRSHPVYHRYGGRGITVCERWEDFACFVADMGERPSPEMTIDRIDNEGPYSPENCRWADRTTQARNRRSTRRYEFDGYCLTLEEWSERTGIRAKLLHARLHTLGWSLQKTLTTPTRRCIRGNNC